MRILVIAEYMAPTQAIASIRWTKIGKYLAKNHDCRIDVLTNQKVYKEQISGAELYAYDDTLRDDLKFFSNVYEIPGTFKGRFVVRMLNAVKCYRKRKRNLEDEVRSESTPVLGTSVVANKLGDSYLRFKEASYLSSALKMDIPWGEYDVVISTYGPKWTHLVAEQIKGRYPHLIWIADYRDLVIDAGSDISIVNSSFSKTHTKNADYVFGVARDAAQLLGIPEGQRYATIYNGFDPAEATQRKRTSSDRFLLAYTGILYNNPPLVRDITPVFRSLSELIRQGSLDSKDVLFVYCGTSESEFFCQAAEYPNVPVRSLGQVKRLEARELQDSASILIFSTWNTESSRGALSGKLYEYMSSEVPVASICSGELPDGEPSEVVRRAKIGFAYDEVNQAVDYPLLKEFLLEKYHEWKRAGITTRSADMEYIKTFQHENIAKQVYDIISGLKANQRKQQETQDLAVASSISSARVYKG